MQLPPNNLIILSRTNWQLWGCTSVLQCPISRDYFSPNNFEMSPSIHETRWPNLSTIRQETFQQPITNFPMFLQVAALRHSIVFGKGIHRWEISLKTAITPDSQIDIILLFSPEQFAFDPFSITLFLYSMSMLEGQTSQQSREEVSLGFNFFDQSIFINRMYFSVLP